MTSFRDVYDDSPYLAADDMPEGKEYNLEVGRVEEELIGQAKDRKLVAYFTTSKKGLVLNKTNGRVLATKFGDDTDKWTGAKIILYTIWTEFQGNPTRGLRIRLGDHAPPPDLSEFSNEALSGTDDLPF